MWRHVVSNNFVGQTLRFGIVGVMNTAVGIAAVYFNIYVLGMGDIWGNFIGYVFGLLCGFLLHRTWTFRATNAMVVGLIKYLLAFAIAYAFNLFCVLELRHFGTGVLLAHASGIVPYVVIFFLLNRYAVFAKTEGGLRHGTEHGAFAEEFDDEAARLLVADTTSFPHLERGGIIPPADRGSTSSVPREG